MAPDGSPKPLGDEVPPLGDRLSGATGLFVGLDFDGTLTPIVDDPNEPTITEANRRILRRLRDRPDAAVAVISGRGLSDLESRVDVDGLSFAGNHGLEFYVDGEQEVHPSAANFRSTVRRASDHIGKRLADVPGWEIEDKGATATVHVRHVPDERIDEVRSAIHSVVGELTGDLDVVTGKAVFELRPPIEHDKGTAIERLSEDVPDGWVTLYVGDDTTDEDAFRAVQPDGVGITVGNQRSTAAAYQLEGQEDVAPFLEWLTVEVLGGSSESATTA